MKKLTLTALILIASISVMAQSKKKQLTAVDSLKAFGLSSISASTTANPLAPAITPKSASLFSVGNTNEVWLTITPMPNYRQIDSVIIFMHKSQVHWLNDSTAVFIKPKK